MSGRYRPGSLEKIKTAQGVCWYVRIQTTVNGKRTRIRERVGLEKDFPSKSAARRAAQVIVDRFNAVPDSTRAAKRRFNEVIERYISEEMPARHSTKKSYTGIIRNHIRPKWGNEFLDEIKAMDARAWLKEMDCSTRRRGNIHGLMRVLFRFAMLWEWMPQGQNPMSLFRLEGSTKREKEPNVLTREQFAAVLAQIEKPVYRTPVLLAIGLGLRCSELFGLKWKDIGEDTIKVERAIVDGHVGAVKTVHSKKALPLHPDLAAVLAGWKKVTEYSASEDWVFSSWYVGGENPPPVLPSNVQIRILLPAGKRAGLPFNLGWHTFRHSYRSWLDELGLPLTVQRDLMRHADVRTTAQIYGATSMATLRSANEKLIEMPALRRKA